MDRLVCVCCESHGRNFSSVMFYGSCNIDKKTCMYWYCTALDEDMTVVIKKISFSCVVYLGPATRERFLLRCANILLLCIGVARTYVIHGIQTWIVKSP